MKKIGSAIALLLLAGCASPMTPAPTGAASNGATPSGAAPTALGNGEASEMAATASIAGPVARRAYRADDVKRIVVRYKNGSGEKQYKGMALGRNLTHLERTAVYQLEAGEELQARLAELRNNPDVEFAEPDFRVYAFEDAASVNDPKLPKQWALPKMQVPTAWSAGKGGPLVAVIDTGVDYNHPDLAGQVLKGYDFINHDDDPQDDVGHGTHVAGAIAALTNNGVGIAGIASASKILAIKVLGPEGGSASDIADGIGYAVDNGAKIINMSLGAPEDSQLIHKAIQRAMDKGVLVVSAAGNDGKTTKNYPAAYPGVVAVGATDSNDQRTSFSQYGSWLTIAAPGSQIMATWPGAKYKNLDGTSMASPQVAGVAALVMGQHPDWSAQQVKSAIETSGDPVSGFESAPGVKRINAAKALGLASAPAPVVSTPPVTEAPAPDEDTSRPGQGQNPGGQMPGGYPQMPGGQQRPMPGYPQMPGGQQGQMPGYPQMPGARPAPYPVGRPMPGQRIQQPMPGHHWPGTRGGMLPGRMPQQR